MSEQTIEVGKLPEERARRVVMDSGPGGHGRKRNSCNV
jgi:hypothetical protein